ncbi:glycosyltransferase [Lihuaxuella thermophila]|uniref:Spore maturation protein CgeB n=1 Tax=Lihuaxuella thermophila TaxID=1173111 RepID=A0A1H8DXV1_9BACL|nr:glycosyltransferase [Lihuaxuella thermophila]SEN12102.1 Spore maturation protein CgeB [Lihuaxuella thermophila]
MFNLLILTADVSPFLYKNDWYLFEEVKKLTNCVVLTHDVFYKADCNIVELIKISSFQPDFILINEIMGGWYTKGCKNINIPIGYMVHDVQSNVDFRRKFLSENAISLIFSFIKHKFVELYPEFTDKFRWLPHHVNTSIFKDYGLQREINSLFMGNTSPLYPLRKKVIEKMRGQPGFVHHVHPGYLLQPGKDSKPVFVGEQYAKEINRAKMFFTCCSIYKYPLLKYFEVLACRTLLLADSCEELKELGFKPDKHFVEINEHNFYQKYLYYLNNEMKRNQIATDGHQFVTKYHSTRVRAQQLVKYIADILKK